ncbi:hypothetical protein DFH11DRAFT_1725822 [Phellopilus nigrolimitatus]|nr:hypothetical protein DFH11DRAFT_1725822 [Phellopilus nigrolimitatus]
MHHLRCSWPAWNLEYQARSNQAPSPWLCSALATRPGERRRLRVRKRTKLASYEPLEAGPGPRRTDSHASGTGATAGDLRRPALTSPYGALSLMQAVPSTHLPRPSEPRAALASHGVFEILWYRYGWHRTTCPLSAVKPAAPPTSCPESPASASASARARPLSRRLQSATPGTGRARRRGPPPTLENYTEPQRRLSHTTYAGNAREHLTQSLPFQYTPASSARSVIAMDTPSAPMTP